jgi:hypothetical protein
MVQFATSRHFPYVNSIMHFAHGRFYQGIEVAEFSSDHDTLVSAVGLPNRPKKKSKGENMLSLPEVSKRVEQSYAYMSFTVRMDEMQKPAVEGFPAIYAFLAEQDISPTGAPFYNYRQIEMSTTLDVEAGIPVADPGKASNNIHFGTLPAGRFAGLDWIGHPDKLEPATAVLIGWTRLMQMEFDMDERFDGDHFACRLEIYETDPEDEPNMEKWLTRLAFKLQD